MEEGMGGGKWKRKIDIGEQQLLEINIKIEVLETFTQTPRK